MSTSDGGDVAPGGLSTGGHPLLMARLEDLKNEYLAAGNGRAANGVVSAMRVVRRYLVQHLDIDIVDFERTTQFGDLPP